MKTLVIIPTLNESQNISKLLVKLSRLYKNIDILVVDDNSTDGTYDIVLKLASKLKNIKIISRKKDIGIGSAHLRGISYAYKKKGDKMTTKQELGLLVNDGGKTKIHLEIWKGMTKLNPEYWIYRK